MNQTLLVELLTEELPPKALAKLGEAFAAGISAGLASRGFLDTDSVAISYATPRRLAVSISSVRAMSPDKSIREKVLPVSVALNAEGQPAAPLLKKLAALAQTAGVGEIRPQDLESAPDGKAESFFYTYTARGSALQGGLQAALEDAVAKLPIPKVMSYQRPDGSTVQFVRPAHKLIALHGADIIPVTLLGLQAGRATLGHRFLAAGELQIANADAYADVLQSQGKIIPGVVSRKEKIRAALLEKAGGDAVLMPEALLDEVTALVEWPVVYACNFEETFLSVPQECLILTMQTNQKYFALTDAGGRLRSRFLIVSNLDTTNPEHIIGGNERVVRPRLSDAKFFFEQDKKKKLAERVPGLASVVYHNKLGTQGQRTERVKTLASRIAQLLGNDTALAERGALLAKADLLTDMVGEFPELQGIMGTYYARHDGEHEEVAQAISEHYQPRFAGDALPATATGTAVALADKLETLVGIWGIGLQPTGDKDPFALRRHALGILRMLVEKRLPLSIDSLLSGTASLFDGNANFKNQKADITTFLFDRLRGLLRERGFAQNEIEAVVAQNPDRLDNIVERLDAVKAFAALPEAESLAAANKRITNILKKAEGATGDVQQNLLQEQAEQGLYSAIAKLKPQVDAAFAGGDFTGTLKSLAHLRDNVDAFFNDVMVMADDEQLRNNRIALLSNLHGMMNRVADISKLAA
ncbi:MAG TPA: glycine--tRNA ligase subunit beta [Noviherbaspirillum sp.]|jgi:glycyl-tRNA synthetase beta chain|uniref:glycine--tRNA ligase subunit beta n=1 Tax=Noviherbaspirillum sp. TaxID=1926288 RepID=UPI002DDCC527|nr:glycine--tRNA ligase subunit beta [Noviherbaspirillum sp.]HEV2611749.1 glycine--tRNA ligase subunit beta [Noviherbaspirillum sp.]